MVTLMRRLTDVFMVSLMRLGGVYMVTLMRRLGDVFMVSLMRRL
jgi:hypothetical protein